MPSYTESEVRDVIQRRARDLKQGSKKKTVRECENFIRDAIVRDEKQQKEKKQ